MKRLLLFALLLIILPAVHPRAAYATGTGPTIVVGSPSLVSGKVQLPVYAWGYVANAYSGFGLHVRWDPNVFSLSNVDPTGGVFDPSAGTGAVCAGPNTSTYDSDGGGMVYGCGAPQATTVTFHVLVTVILTPAASGCSAIHLFTYGPADNGDATSGTYTINGVDNTPESNQYRDGAANVNGQTCTPPALPTSPSPNGPLVPGTPVNCIYDLDATGAVNSSDLVLFAGTFGKSAGMSGFNAAADFNADEVVNSPDLTLFAQRFAHPVSGCTPAYPFYNPGPSWNGALPNGYNSFQYLIFTGAMDYEAGSYDCSSQYPALSGWAFISITTGTNLSACAAAGDLTTLADDIGLWHYSHGLSGTNQVFFGPNDCMAHFNGQSISAAAGVLYQVWQIVTLYAQRNDPSVEFKAVVDDEGYTGVCDSSSAVETQCQTNDVTFFLDYTGPIGPAGARPCEAGDEQALSQAGGGAAIPQVYVYSGALAINPQTGVGCTIDGRSGSGSWPYTIASGYAGVQSYPLPYGYYTSWQANIRWSLCHGTQPAVDFDWSYPGGRG